jgi:hypothetical protein
MRKRFSPDDLNQISRESLDKLKKSEVIQLALRLRDFGIDLHERLNQDSSNSSRPPSSDSPYKKKDNEDKFEQSNTGEQKQDSKNSNSDRPAEAEDQKDSEKSDAGVSRNAGRQPESQGFGRAGKPKVDYTVDHHPQQCIICSAKLSQQASAHTGYYTYDLVRTENEMKITCTLNYY